MQTFTKHDDPVAIAHEASGLRWLAQAEPAGGAPVVPLLTVGRDSLQTRRISATRVTPAAARQFGRALAITHAAGASHYGCAPDGFDLPAGNMGRAPLPFVPPSGEAKDYESSAFIHQVPGVCLPEATATDSRAGAGISWGKFWAEYRIEPYLEYARNNGSISANGVKIIEKLCGRLQAGHFDHAQPSLVKENRVARIHGDLWSGNIMWVPASECDWVKRDEPNQPNQPSQPNQANQNARLGEEVVGVLIDPAAQGGHAECDLACLPVFGQSFLGDIYDGYNQVSALEPGYEERVGLHQLHILMVHAYLFGGGYGYEVVQVARQYV